MNNKKNITILMLLVITAICAAGCQSNDLFMPVTLEDYIKNNSTQEVIKVKVTEVVSTDVEVEDYYGMEKVTEIIDFNGEVIDRNITDETIVCRQVIESTEGYMTEIVSEGDTVFVYPSVENGKVIGDFVEYSRLNYIIVFAIFFAVVVIVFSGLKGLRSLVGLIVTCGIIFLVFIPMIMDGKNIMLSAILTCIVVTILTILIVMGIKKKAFAAIAGCTIGFLIAGGLTYLMQVVLNMTGLIDSNANLLYYHLNLDMNGLLFAGIIIGALGATMDVGVSIASSLDEIISHNKQVKRGELIKSGMKIGGDIMGTMVNTLILAYVGSSMSLIVLMMSNSTQMEYALSWEIFSSEFVRALSGSIGLIFTVPATAVVMALLTRKKETEKVELKPLEDE